jgi:hypothetical protein
MVVTFTHPLAAENRYHSPTFTHLQQAAQAVLTSELFDCFTKLNFHPTAGTAAAVTTVAAGVTHVR